MIKKCKKKIYVGLAILTIVPILAENEDNSSKRSQEAGWKDVASYVSVVLASAGMGVVAGYFDAAQVGSRYDAMIHEINTNSFSRQRYEEALPHMVQSSWIPYGGAQIFSLLQWLGMWWARRSLVTGISRQSDKNWVKQSLGPVSCIVSWTSWAITYMILRKKVVVLKTENFKQWDTR